MFFRLTRYRLKAEWLRFLLGLVFAFTYELTRRFEVPFLLHSACNLAVLATNAAGWADLFRTPMWTIFFAVTWPNLMGSPSLFTRPMSSSASSSTSSV